MSIPQLPQDKANHFIFGVLAYIPAAAFFGPVAGLVTAVVVGAAKELHDSQGHGCVEFYDFLATALGGAAGFLCNHL